MYVNNNFVYLNPYTSLSKCKGEKILVERRLRAVIEEIAPNSVQYHRGTWPYIDAGDGPLKMIWLGGHGEMDTISSVALDLYPADNMRQARMFYPWLNIEKLMSLESQGWSIYPNLHFQFMATHIHWADTPMDLVDYLLYWKTDKRQISQIWRDETGFVNFFKDLLKDNMISDDDLEKLKAGFTETRRQTLNLCPGIGLNYHWPLSEAEKLDNSDQFHDAVVEKVNEAFRTWGQNFIPQK